MKLVETISHKNMRKLQKNKLFENKISLSFTDSEYGICEKNIKLIEIFVKKNICDYNFFFGLFKSLA